MKGNLEESKLLYALDRQAWHAWLAENYPTAKEIWLLFFKKHVSKISIEYDQAVEEALCFGWIDSTIRKIDEDRFARRFTPRRPGSSYSPGNREKLRQLIAQGRVMPDVINALGELKHEPPGR